MKTTPMLLGLFLILASLSVKADLTGADCSTFNQYVANVQLTRISYGDGTCGMSIYPKDSYKMTYRSFGIYSDGMLMVFNSLGNGPDETSAGARVFYFFPRTAAAINYSYTQGAQTLSVNLPDSRTIQFDVDSASPVTVDQGTVTVQKKIHSGNDGGVEFPTYNGLMLDVGWRLGGSPTERMTHKSVFRDQNGKTCDRPNKDLFKKTADDIYFSMNDSELKTYLATYCPGLALGF